MRSVIITVFVLAAIIATVALAHPGHGSLGNKQSSSAKANGEKFLTEKAEETGVHALPSGLLFKVLNRGTGTKTPLVSTRCQVHYAGTLPDGAKFDSSYDRGQPSSFAPNQVIKGWTEALQLMREGDKWEVYIPYYLAYGENGRPPKIPGYSPLVFTMELVKIDGPSQDVSEDVFQKNFGKDYSEL